MNRADLDKNRTLINIVESWNTIENSMNSTEDILQWIKMKNEETKVNVRKIPMFEKGDWYYNQEQGSIVNGNNTFFQIKGLVKQEDEQEDEQPIIIQNEIGYLGIIGKEIDGVLYFLMQAKVEPGNINIIQISPTLQATKSNFMQVHGGKTPKYLEFFSEKYNHEIVVDQIQSEQSSRFMGKRNRNIIIVVQDDVPVYESHKWMTLGQIKQLMHHDNLVNMDTRTVISCIPFALRDYSYKELTHLKTLFYQEPFFNSIFFGNDDGQINRIYQHLNEIKMLDRSKISLVDLYSLKEWKEENGEFVSAKGEYKIVYCDIEIEGREVKRWQQPLIEALGESTFVLMYCIDEGIMKFLVQSVKEVGCFDKVEIGPSIQDGVHKRINKDKVFQFYEYKYAKKEGITFEGYFSEEGGRFYHEQNKNILMCVEKNELGELPEGYFWTDYHTLNILIQFNNCLNIQLRNLLSILDL